MNGKRAVLVFLVPLLLFTGLVASIEAQSREDSPRHTILIVDRSGSMGRSLEQPNRDGEIQKFQIARQAVKLYTDLARQANQPYELSLVAFAKETDVLQKRVDPRRNLQALFDSVEGIQRSRKRGTDFVKAVRAVRDQELISNSERTEIILLTDGTQTEDVKKIPRLPVPIHGIAFDVEQRASTLRSLCNRSNGTVQNVGTPGKLLGSYLNIFGEVNRFYSDAFSLEQGESRDHDLPSFVKVLPWIVSMKVSSETDPLEISGGDPEVQNRTNYTLYNFQRPTHQFGLSNRGDTHRVLTVYSPAFRIEPSIDRYPEPGSSADVSIQFFDRKTGEPYSFDTEQDPGSVMTNFIEYRTKANGDSDNTTKIYLNNNGRKGDRQAGDHVWSNFSQNWPNATKSLNVRVRSHIQGLGTLSVNRRVRLLNLYFQSNLDELPEYVWGTEQPETVRGWFERKDGSVVDQNAFRNQLELMFKAGSSEIGLVDDGSEGDRQANDGRFGRSLDTFDATGQIDYELTAKVPILDDGVQVDQFTRTKQGTIHRGTVSLTAPEPWNQSQVGYTDGSTARLQIRSKSSFATPLTGRFKIDRVDSSTLAADDVQIDKSPQQISPGSDQGDTEIVISLTENASFPAGKQAIRLRWIPEQDDLRSQLSSASPVTVTVPFYVETWWEYYMPYGLGIIVVVLVGLGSWIGVLKPSFSTEYIETDDGQELLLKDLNPGGAFTESVPIPASNQVYISCGANPLASSYQLYKESGSGDMEDVEEVEVDGIPVMQGESVDLVDGSEITVDSMDRTTTYVFHNQEFDELDDL